MDGWEVGKFYIMWNKLSMKDKARVMQMAVQSGITNLADIKDAYNSYGDGGYIDWESALLQVAPYLSQDVYSLNPTYDYKGFFNDNPEEAWKQIELLKQNKEAHFIDKFKRPNHPTFSDESIYSDAVTPGGHWTGNDKEGWIFNHSPYTAKHYIETTDYLRNTGEGHELNGEIVFPIGLNSYKQGGKINKFDEGGNSSTFNLLDYIKEKAINTAEQYIKDNPNSTIVSTVRRRLYDNLSPYEYTSGSKSPEQRIVNALIGKSENGSVLGYSGKRDDIFAEYLQIPKEQRHIFDNPDDLARVIDSDYKPTKSNSNIQYKTLSDNALRRYRDDDGNIKYKTKSDLFYKNGKPKDIYYVNSIDDLIEDAQSLKLNENKVSGALSEFFGSHTIGRGLDKTKGEYISFYDKWDLTPRKEYGEDESKGMGKPIEFYDRVYLDDYYDIPKDKRLPIEDAYYGGYLPEVSISAQRPRTRKKKKIEE